MAEKIKNALLPFVLAFVLFCLAFLLLDFAIMHLRGLTLIFHG